MTTNESAWHQPQVKRRSLRYWWWLLINGPVVAAWRAAHQRKLPKFCPESGRRLTYSFDLFTPAFDATTGTPQGEQSVIVEAYPWNGGSIWQWVPNEAVREDGSWTPLPGEGREAQAFAPHEWEGSLMQTPSVLVKWF